MVGGDPLRLFVGLLQRCIARPIGKEGARVWMLHIPRQGKELIFPIGLYLHIEPPELVMGILYRVRHICQGFVKIYIIP